MRARSLKPGFFKNEYLAELGPYAQLLFEGLWCLADREGKLEDRPKRIKAEVFPYYDPKPDVETLLCKLQEAGFISRYSVNGFKLIKVLNFTKHQSPHSTEKPSIYPDPPQNSEGLSLINESASVNSRKHNALTPDSLTPDSLTPDSLTSYSGGEVLEKTNLNPKREVPQWAEAYASASVRHATQPDGPHMEEVFVDGSDGEVICNLNGKEAPEITNVETAGTAIASRASLKKSPPRFTPTDLMGLWNSLGCRPLVSELTDERRKKVHLRIRKRGDPAWWRRLFEKVKELNKPWLTFDFLIRNDTNSLKVLEGAYDHDFRDRRPELPEWKKQLLRDGSIRH